MDKQKYHRDWEELAELDPKWAILTKPGMKHNRWDEKDFFNTGKNQVESLFKLFKELNLSIPRNAALDFGCGIGRVTYVLAGYFNKVYGVDISEKMVKRAKALFEKNKKIEFIRNTDDNLRCFNDNQFDLIYSLITLQHIPDKNQIKSYLAEFIRILKPGGLCYFQLPSVANYSWLKSRLLMARGFLYYFFVCKIGLPKEYCYSRLKLAPFMHMSYMDSKDIKIFFKEASSKIWVFNDNSRETIYLVQKKVD